MASRDFVKEMAQMSGDIKSVAGILHQVVQQQQVMMNNQRLIHQQICNFIALQPAGPHREQIFESRAEVTDALAHQNQRLTQPAPRPASAASAALSALHSTHQPLEKNTSIGPPPQIRPLKSAQDQTAFTNQLPAMSHRHQSAPVQPPSSLPSTSTSAP
jgi:hypothetical protein